MGCDIHCHIEVKINGRWEHWSAPDISRDYALFSRMAGVREFDGSPPPIAEPRGFVEDPTIPTEIEWKIGDGDWHSASWLTGAELEALIEERGADLNRRIEALEPSDPRRRELLFNPWTSWRRGGFGYLFGNGFDVRRFPEDNPDGVEDCRLVFWFDN